MMYLSSQVYFFRKLKVSFKRKRMSCRQRKVQFSCLFIYRKSIKGLHVQLPILFDIPSVVRRRICTSTRQQWDADFSLYSHKFSVLPPNVTPDKIVSLLNPVVGSLNWYNQKVKSQNYTQTITLRQTEKNFIFTPGKGSLVLEILLKHVLPGKTYPFETGQFHAIPFEWF